MILIQLFLFHDNIDKVIISILRYATIAGKYKFWHPNLWYGWLEL